MLTVVHVSDRGSAMWEASRRLAVPVIAFVIGAGLEIGGFENRWVAWVLFAIAAVYAAIALVTWPSLHDKASRFSPIRIRVERKRIGDDPPAAVKLDDAAQYITQQTFDELKELREERAAMQGEISDLGEQIAKLADDKNELGKQLLIENNSLMAREVELAALKPKVEWADRLIEGARGLHPLHPLGIDLGAADFTGLDALEPYFDISVGFHYCGVHRLIVARKFEGHLARFNREEFNAVPKIEINWHEKPPFDQLGPTFGTLRLHQKVTRESADDLKQSLGLTKEEYRGTERRVEFVTGNLFVSVELMSFNDEELFSGGFFYAEFPASYMI